jgi:glycosyltransferase involved in cell wall biosynthesis
MPLVTKTQTGPFQQAVTLDDLLYTTAYKPRPARIPDSAASPKVVHLCWMDAGGAGIAAYRLHRGLCAMGTDSTFLVLQKNHCDQTVAVLPARYASGSVPAGEPGACDDKIMVKNDRRWRLYLMKYPNRLKDAELFTDISSDLKLHYVKEIQAADIINLHWVAGVVDYPTLPLAAAEKPVVWTMHDMNPFTGGCHYAENCTRYTAECGMCPNLGSHTLQDISWHFMRQKREAFANLDITVVTPSVWLGDCSRHSALMGRFPHHVIPYGLSTATFRPYNRQEVRRLFNIPEDAFVVLFGAAALHIKRKGYAYLLQALDTIEKSGKAGNIMLGIYGMVSEDMPLPDAYRHILFGPIIGEESLAQIYSAADVYVIPTIEDNLPNTVLEALACGLPVVGFRTGGVPDMLEHQKNGYLVDQRDVNGLATGILWAQALGPNAADISAYCRARAVERWDETVQAAAYHRLYTAIRDRKADALRKNQEGEEYALKGDAAAAIACFEAASRKFPHLARTYNNLGAMQWQNSETEKAVASFMHANRVNPDDRTALLNLGDALDEQRIGEEILPHAQAFVDRHPEDTQALGLLVKAQERLLESGISRGMADSSLFINRDYRITAVVIIMHPLGFIRKTIEDLAQQSIAASTEIICVDAVHQVESADAFSDLAAGHRNLLYFRPLAPVKRFEALNLGLSLGRGRSCMALVSGDRLALDACDKLAAGLDQHPEAAIAYGDTYLTRIPMQSMQQTGACETMTLAPAEFRDLCTTYGIGPHPMWRRSIHRSLGYFDTRLEAEADQDMWLRALRTHHCVHLPQTTGMIWLNDAVPLRIPTSAEQYARIRSKYRVYPHATQTPPIDEQPAREDITTMQYINRFITVIAQLVEQGKHREALELYDQQRGSLPDIAEMVKFDELIKNMRTKVS